MISYGIIIPARIGSTRLPNKMILPIHGEALIYRTVENALKDTNAKFVVVATDSELIEKALKGICKVVYTSKECITGTDRVAEAISKLNIDVDVIVNLQGDEPFLDITSITHLVNLFNIKDCEIATAYYNLPTQEVDNPNKVKLVCTNLGKALYFSRSVIPFNKIFEITYKGHIGLYAYKKNILSLISALPKSKLEEAESLEQLRWLENEYTIYCTQSTQTLGIDTLEDWQMANSLFN